MHHLFFECCVATALWNHLSEIFEIQIGANFEFVAHWWVSNNKNSTLNTCGAVLLWTLWKLRNYLSFQEKSCKDEMVQLATSVQDGGRGKLKWAIDKVKNRSLQPLLLTGGSWGTLVDAISTSIQ